MKNIFAKIQNYVATLIGKINWKTNDTLTQEEIDTIKQKLKKHYYIILTRHNGHLSAYAISFAHWVLTKGTWGFYGHALMNLEDTVKTDDDYRFIEATGRGTHYSNFNEAIDTQTSSVALLKPRCMTLAKWTKVMDKARTAVGRPYDTLFDLTNDKSLSCVELIRFALQAEPNYKKDFAHFEEMIAKNKNLDPQMFYECRDFEIVWETRH